MLASGVGKDDITENVMPCSRWGAGGGFVRWWGSVWRCAGSLQLLLLVPTMHHFYLICCP